MEGSRALICGKDFSVYSLMCALHLETELYPGNPSLQRIVQSQICEGSSEHYAHLIGDHVFTPHGDAPKHKNPDLQELGFDYWLQKPFFHSALLIDCAPQDSRAYRKAVDVSDLSDYTPFLRAKEAVLVRTGYDTLIEQNRRHSRETIPYFTQDAGRFLSSFSQLRVVGIDSLTVDKPGSSVVHQLLKDKFILEGLVHLSSLPYYEFTLQTVPVALKGATGGPVVALAFFPCDEEERG